MINKVTLTILSTIFLALPLFSQPPAGDPAMMAPDPGMTDPAMAAPGMVDPAIDPEEEIELLEIDLPLFERYDDYNILSPRRSVHIYHQMEEGDTIYPFQRRLIGQEVLKRMFLDPDSFEEFQQDVVRRTQQLNLDAQGQTREVADIWYSYWRLFNAYEEYLERYILEEPLASSSISLPRYIANVPDEEFDPEQMMQQQQMMQMGGTPAMGASSGGPSGSFALDRARDVAGGPMAGAPQMMTPTRDRREVDIGDVLPPVFSEEARQRVEELLTSHINQLERVLSREYEMEQGYQARLTQPAAQRDVYDSWKEEQTENMLFHLQETTDLIDFDIVEE